MRDAENRCRRLFVRLLTRQRLRADMSGIKTCNKSRPNSPTPLSLTPIALFIQNQPPSPKPNVPHMRRISCSLVYFSKPESRCCHHSKSVELQMSLNHGV